jgi:hypothetical protein
MTEMESAKIWDLILKKVPSDYVFEVKTGKTAYQKGS